jgi:hypothetical protein
MHRYLDNTKTNQASSMKQPLNDMNNKVSSLSSNDNTQYSLEMQRKKKYFAVWRKYTLKRRKNASSAKVLTEQKVTTSSTSSGSIYDYDLHSNWLSQCLFCQYSRSVRILTCNIIQSLFTAFSATTTTENQKQPKEVLSKKLSLAELLCQFLYESSSSGEHSAEYFQLFKTVLEDKDCKYRLVINCGVLSIIEALLCGEIQFLCESERRMSDDNVIHSGIGCVIVSRSSINLTHGYSIKNLSQLLAHFLKDASIKDKFKSRLVATVVYSYL